MPQPAFNNEQIDRYLKHIQVPSKYHRKSSPPLDYNFLRALHTHHLSTIPYENLSLHYSTTHQISLDPQHLYQKFLAGRGRGGYCMEVSIFFNHVLRALGFNAYLAGVRIRNRIVGVPEGPYRGWVHVVNLVTLEDGSKWHVDVGFGGDGATKPLPLLEDVVTRNIGTQDLRLVKGNIDEQLDKSQKLWIYQYRNSTTQPWNSFYVFPETEFLEVDFEPTNFYVSNSERSFQTTTVLIIRFLRRLIEGDENKDGEEEVYGKVMLLNGVVKLNTGGKTEVIKTCKNENERLEVIKEHFGIELTEDEKEGIRGWRTEILEVLT